MIVTRISAAGSVPLSQPCCHIADHFVLGLHQVSGGGLKGAGGSIKALQLHMDLPIIAAAGLDRFLRLYDAHTRK